jgi:MerR family transcriptional regulator/heat shock protein HspR
MRGYEDSQPRFVISIAARMLGVHAQTLRYYERAGMIEPSRSRGNRRLYSMEDMERLRRIKALIDDLGVNLAGVEVIMRMGERMAEMEKWLRIMELELKRLS